MECVVRDYWFSQAFEGANKFRWMDICWRSWRYCNRQFVTHRRFLMRSIHQLGAAIVAGLLAFSLAACGNSGGGNGTTQAASMNGNPAQPAGFWQKVMRSSPTTVTIPEGSPINVRLDDSISTARNRSGDTFRATLS